MNRLEAWNIDKSTQLYGYDNWGEGYFGINHQGEAVVRPNGKDGPEISLPKLVQAARDREINLPVLFRFNDILRHRVHLIYQAFQDAIKEHNYSGSFYPVYPIKVNQQHHVVEVLTETGNQFSMGLEVGSKPELIAVLAQTQNEQSLLLCNGYKDQEYLELALMSKKIGRRPIIILEKFSELALVNEVAESLNVELELGIRIRLSGKGSGRWELSGGDRAKFGLSISEILRAVAELERIGKISCLRMLHFHIGSQLTAISSLRSGLKEAAQIYAQLKPRAAELTLFDIGGGLAVDYDGSRTSFESSMNYTLTEYARDVIWILDDICAQADVPQPDIVTESGRATTAFHSVLVFDVLGIANTFSESCDAKEVIESSSQLNVQNLGYLLLELTPKNCQETLHDAVALRAEILQQFNLGLLSIEDRALADRCYWAILKAVSEATSELHYVPKDLERLPELLTDTYFCNLSIFQSLPDSWAIEHIFPITPIDRLNEQPNRRVVLADITCDSDGKIDRFADQRQVRHYLPAHDLEPGKPYHFAAFLVGAYQEILGDMHNLFGDTNAVHIEVGSEGDFRFSQIIRGDTIAEVLQYVQFNKHSLLERWRNSLESAVRRGQLSAAESAIIYRKYESAFSGYTYLVGNNKRPS